MTEQKTSDRTQYEDRLEGDILRWQGQLQGRTDALIVDHRARGIELLLFQRSTKRQYPGGGFRYEGPFDYVRHSGSAPTSFVLRRVRRDLEQAVSEDLQQQGAFDPSSVEDARRKTVAAIVQRRGQGTFRQALLAAYEGKCAISGCSVPEVVEAAHIHPYLGDATNHPTNGLLLRADLHTLFDCGLIGIDSASETVVVAGALRGSEYESLEGASIRVPKEPFMRPSAEALDLHRSRNGL